MMLVYFILLITFTFTDCGPDNTAACPARKDVTRRCMKSCAKESCKSPRKECLCDGECGSSCINKNLECEELRVFENGNVKIIPANKFGAIAKYDCNEGYRMEGPKNRVCRGDGKWSDEEPRCTLTATQPVSDRSDCPGPPIVIHASHDGDPAVRTYPLRTVLKYTCDDGFESSPGEVVRAWCVEGGSWVGPRMTCSSNGCPRPTSPINGGVSEPYDGKIGSTMSYFCNEGFALAGSSTRSCLSSGVWDGVEPTCDKVTCGEPPEVLNAKHNGQQQERYQVGHELTYSCRIGFDRTGSYRAVCNGSGNWVGLSLTCMRVTCGFPGSVENGWTSGFLYNYPESIQFNCNQGYELIGNRERKCLATGEWSGQLPVCRAVECQGITAPKNGTMVGSGNAYGTVLRFECNRNFQLAGSVERRCQANKTWSGIEARCQEVECSWPTNFWNGYIVGADSKIGSTLFFSCHVRFKFHGSAIDAVCLKNGSWSNSPPQCLGQCNVPSVLDVDYRDVKAGTWVDHATVIRYRCINDFVPAVANVVECKNGTWSSSPKCVPAPCHSPPPHLENGWRIFSGRGHGRKAKYICRNGYRLAGISRKRPFLTCQNNRWIGGKPRCQQVFCPNPGTIDHGLVFKKEPNNVKFLFQEYIKTIRHGQRLVYECDEGYIRVGASGATCIDGAWQPPLGERDSHCQQQMYLPFPKQWTPIPGQNFHE